MKNQIQIVTSAVSLVEVNKLDSPPLRQDQSKKILDFFENPYISVRAVDREVAERAHAIVRDHGLTNLDAIHIATACISKAAVFYTYDGTKPKRKGLIKYSLQIGDPPLTIQAPPDPLKGTLFDETLLPETPPASIPMMQRPTA
jgi:hypothetical protein